MNFVPFVSKFESKVLLSIRLLVIPATEFEKEPSTVGYGLVKGSILVGVNPIQKFKTESVIRSSTPFECCVSSIDGDLPIKYDSLPLISRT